jgi:hypothetical protein
MQGFYILEIGLFTQYKYAWFEPTDLARYSKEEAPRCAGCGCFVGGCQWLEPHDVVLKQPRQVGDFVSGPGGCDFLVSRPCLEALQNAMLRGIKRSFPINVVRMGTTKKGMGLPVPELWGVDVIHSNTRADFSRMDVEWSGNPPSGPRCPVCGCGGSGGWLKSWKRVVIEQNSWSGDDLFHAVNFTGKVILSARAAGIVASGGFTNARLIPCEDYAYSFNA